MLNSNKIKIARSKIVLTLFETRASATCPSAPLNEQQRNYDCGVFQVPISAISSFALGPMGPVGPGGPVGPRPATDVGLN